MIELTKHIEILLLENDCVIVPELGGFIAHYQPARYEEAEGVFLPPYRAIGFNPQLTMNDGLLTQSYMQAYHTDFPDASRKIAQVVKEVKDTLHEDGFVSMHGIGNLYYTIHNTYEFHPNESGILSPSLYALDSFPIQTLSADMIETPAIETEKPQSDYAIEPERKEIKMVPHWLSHAVAVAVAVILFFALSIPVENTYIDKGNYASLGTDCLFDAIRSQSVATTLVESKLEAPAEQNKKTTEIAPVVVKVEKVSPAPVPVEPKAEKKDASNHVETKPTVEKKAPVAPAPKKETPAPKSKKYHVIVASLTTQSDAQKMLKNYNRQGYNEVSVVEGNGRFRISLCHFANRADAQEKLDELKKSDSFNGAWILTSK